MEYGETMKSVKLDRRIIQTAMDLKVIKNDHKRDAKPWWKYDRLDLEIMDIAHEVELLNEQLIRMAKSNRETAKELRQLANQLKLRKLCKLCKEGKQ